MPARSRPLLLGHRGARATKSIPENTIASFDLCLQHGCDGFEFDVRATADGSLVVCHDESFRGFPLAKMSMRELENWQAQGFLPFLEDVLRRYSGKCFLDIELKVAGVEASVVELLWQYPPARGYVVTSFLPEVLGRVRALDDSIELGYLFDRPSRDNAVSGHFPFAGVKWMLPEWYLLDASMASNLRKSNACIGAWTVNETLDMRRLAALGVEMLISDETQRLVNTLGVG